MPHFTPPARIERAERHSPIWWDKHRVGITVLKENGTYVEVIEPSQERTLAAEAAYVGGYRHEVSEDEAADLTSAGYAANITA